MLEKLKQEVCEANIELVAQGLVIYTFGNVSGIDRQTGIIAIKPSGVDYDRMKPSDMVLVKLNGEIAEGDYRPSSDLATHLALYNAFDDIGGICHTHSLNATAFAQAGKPIPCFGTTHADYFHGDVPVTRDLTSQEISGSYESETGNVIVELLKSMEERPNAVLVRSHAPFAWGKDAAESVYYAKIVDIVAQLARDTYMINPRQEPAPQALMDKHYYRKHGTNAYYGQK